MKCLTMDKFVLEIPNFIPYDICESIVDRFENDNRKVEGSFTYPVNDQMITRKKNNFELSSTTLGGGKMWTHYSLTTQVRYMRSM